jgi:hypothetical protein
MKVCCIQDKMTEQQKLLFGIDLNYDPNYQITINKEYIVLGISFFFENNSFGSLAFYEILDDVKSYCTSMPFCLFEIIDPRVSSYWEIKINNKAITIWPEEFSNAYFFDDLSEGKQTICETFTNIYKKLQNEYSY